MPTDPFRLIGKIFLWLLASPVLLYRGLRRAMTHYRFVVTASQPSISCECGADIALVGLWRCSCGFTYRGHLLRECPVCYSIPSVVRCYHCGVTTRLPDAE